MTTIVDFGTGNIGSVANAFTRLGILYRLATSREELDAAERLLLCGVGNFRTAVQKLNNSGLRPALERAVLERNCPVLGICLGFQLLTDRSDEGDIQGLGFIRADTHRLHPDNDQRFTVPRIGWVQVCIRQSAAPLLQDVPTDAAFYFSHSYHVVPEREDSVLMTVDYGQPLVAACADRHIMGVQFHPEKSYDAGDRILQNFSKLST